MRTKLVLAILGERHEYIVHLPAGYDATPHGHFPVLYVLDGLAQSAHSAESAALLARVGAIPPVIVVGVPNISRRSRARDFSPPDQWAGAHRSSTSSAASSCRTSSGAIERRAPARSRGGRRAACSCSIHSSPLLPSLNGRCARPLRRRPFST